MTPEDVIRYFGRTQIAAAAALGCSQSTVSEWFRAGYVPAEWQHYIAARSGGTLQVDGIGIVNRLQSQLAQRRSRLAMRRSAAGE